ncbi:hypothetical protein [Nocardia stercoris]|uniref:Uncharacterized protein n=1 Tax=Nocardia stercoris TaxID=2483361 RepID=A0A3M2KZI4_9NOCA|nr:hypothetical protein [Nocardia stercoris]RMI30554.1 hypothetical protein EBN03_20980 [Nocardia stercoris]
MQRYRAAFDTVGGCAAAVIAGLALVVPGDAGCATGSSALQMMQLIVTVPRATAVGVVVAVLVAVCARIYGTRAAWGTATIAALVVVADHLLIPDTSASLATANFVDSVAAGSLLGAAGAAALEYRPPAIGYVLGALTSVTVGNHIRVAAAAGNGGSSLLERSFVDLPPTWLTVPTVGLLAVSFLLCRRTETSSYPTVLHLPFGPVLAAAIVITTTTVVSERLSSERIGTAAIVVGLFAVLAAAVLAALLLPGRDGTLLLLAVSLAATGNAIAVATQAQWKLVPMLLAMALGLAAGRLRPAPVVAGVAIVAIGVFALLIPDVRHDDSVAALVGGGAVAALGGYSFGAATTRTAAATVLAIGVLFIPTAVLTLEFDGCTPLPVLSGRGGASAARAAWTAVTLGVGCVAAIVALRRWRPERDRQG